MRTMTRVAVATIALAAGSAPVARAQETLERTTNVSGGWIGLARICRCGPFGTSGLDLVPETLPEGAGWYKPWAYGRWRGVNAPPIICEAIEPDGG